MAKFNYDAPLCEVARQHQQGVTHHVVRVRCSCPGCTSVFERPLNGPKPFPREAMQQFLTNAGWRGNARRVQMRCPDHA